MRYRDRRRRFVDRAAQAGRLPTRAEWERFNARWRSECERACRIAIKFKILVGGGVGVSLRSRFGRIANAE